LLAIKTLKLIDSVQKYQIAIITCWYGPYPWYFPYFIHSCNYNPSIDFILITNNPESIPNKSQNVKIIYKTLDEIRNTATEKLGFPVNIDYPYKLCDFKPAYGFLFPEIIKGYDFWGHGDIDVVYGDIRNFMTDKILSGYDIISSRHDYITGTFCLFKSNERVNTLFMKSRDYKLVLSSAEHFCFDECNFLFSELQNGASIFDYPDNIQSMTWVVKKAESEGKLKAYFDFIIIEGTPGNVMWHNGRVFYKKQYEAMFYHLIKFKETCKKKKILFPIPKTFCFGPKSIFRKRLSL
jgi:hypothetical protein